MRELIVARAAENKTQSIFCWLFVENNSMAITSEKRMQPNRDSAHIKN